MRWRNIFPQGVRLACFAFSGFLCASEQPRVLFETDSQFFKTTLSIHLKSSTGEAEIHFTTDGSAPSELSQRYQKPFSVTASTQVRARLFAGGKPLSEIGMATYLKEGPSVLPFQSNLPLVILKSWDQRRPSDSRYQDIFCSVIEPADSGLTQLGHPFSFSTRAGIKVRGSSTAKNPKPSFNLELRDEEHRDRAASLLDLPADSDWVLRAPYAMDRALLRNALVFKLSRKLGHYAPRTRFVEVFLDHDDNGIKYPEDYLGVYTLTEKIKRGPQRVRIHKLGKDERQEPDLTGGYLFKDDRADPGDQGITLPDLGRYFLVDPKEGEIAPEQSRYLRNHLTNFTLAVKSPSGKHPISKEWYRDFIDLRSWLVWHWLNLLSGNLDTYKASAYFYKNHESRNEGRIEAGPLWDFDRSLNSFDERDDSPFGWIANGEGGSPFSDSRAPWWGWLLSHQDAKQAHLDLWHEMRAEVLSWESLETMIDELAHELQGGGLTTEQGNNSPVKRNFGKWIEVSPRGGNHAHEIKILKDWLKLRLQWIDAQYLNPPAIGLTSGLTSGLVPQGSKLPLTGPRGAQIYYTTDGTDPLDSPSARVLSPGKKIEIPHSLVLKARSRLGLGPNAWSGVLRRVFLVGAENEADALSLSEVAWQPKATAQDGPFQAWEFEFLKITNTSHRSTIDLTGAHFTKGIRFNFEQASITSLKPNTSLYLAYTKEAFLHRYRSEKEHRIAGEFRPSRLNNGGETIELRDGMGRVLLKHINSTSKRPPQTK